MGLSSGEVQLLLGGPGEVWETSGEPPDCSEKS